MYQTHILKNGLKVIHQQVDGKAAWCGLIIGVGSRDERPEEEGIAHFIEHVIFKGTEKRKAFHILSRIEDVGGELNAYTTKEDTCIYASFLARDYERALELFADIVFHSVFPEKEIEKEKEVVIDEINSYKDSPGELIFDDFEELIYPDYPIGRNILGSEKAVKGLRRDDIIDFVKRNYRPGRMVISSVGDIPFDKLVRLIERYFGDIPGDPAVLVRERPGIYLPRQKVIDMDTYQNHCIIGNVAYDYTEDKRLAFSLLVNILGGTGMNSRLNLNIREKYGLAYNIEASYTPYSDTGIFTIYFGCDAGDLDKCLRLCRKEMAALGEELLGYMRQQAAADNNNVKSLYQGQYYMSSGEGADFRIVPNANVPSGEAFVSSRLNETADDGNCIGKQIVISTESIYGSDSMTVKISKTYSKSNLEKLTGVTYKDSQSGEVYVNEEDYNRLINKGIFQSSVYVDDVKGLNTVIEDLEGRGFNTLAMRDARAADGADIVQIVSMMKTFMLAVLIIALFFISYFIIRIVLKSRNAYYTTLRTLGASRRISKQLLDIELFVTATLAYAVFMAVMLLVYAGVITQTFAVDLAGYLEPANYVIMYLIIIAMSYMISQRFARKLFKDSVMNTYREEV